MASDEYALGVEGNTKILVMSPYFQHKVTPGNEETNEKENVRTDECENTNPGYECKSASDAGEAKTRVKNRKTITRSSYFLDKQVNENDQDKRHEEILKNDLAVYTCDYAPHESASSADFNSSSMKRKVAFVERVQMENTNSKYIRTNESLPIQGSSISTRDDTIMETQAEEGKFGCNISHLENYSDIADKSIERFVSVISSFRCPSSGSRASGLRAPLKGAPLKDVRNTCTSRSNRGPDFSDFAYVPTKRKTFLRG